MILDLSFIELGEHGNLDALDFRALGALRELALESCSLTTLRFSGEDDADWGDGVISPLYFLHNLLKPLQQ